MCSYAGEAHGNVTCGCVCGGGRDVGGCVGVVQKSVKLRKVKEGQQQQQQVAADGWCWLPACLQSAPVPPACHGVPLSSSAVADVTVSPVNNSAMMLIPRGDAKLAAQVLQDGIYGQSIRSSHSGGGERAGNRGGAEPGIWINNILACMSQAVTSMLPMETCLISLIRNWRVWRSGAARGRPGKCSSTAANEG